MRKTFWLFAFCLPWISTLHAQQAPSTEDAAEAANRRVPYEVLIESSDPSVRELMRSLTIVKRRDESRVQERGGVRENALRRLIDTTPEEATRLLATEGYFSPVVTATLDRSAEPERVIVRIEPGEQTHVTSVQLTFRGDLLRQPEDASINEASVRSKWPLEKGAVFRSADWEGAKRAVLAQLLGNRYPAARLVSSRAAVDPEQRSAQLEVVYDSGPPFFLGGTEVIGADRYPRSIVERLNPIAPGTEYSQRLLADFQARLQGTQYYTAVNVTAEPGDVTGDQPVTIPVTVQLVEAKRYSVDFGLGFSTNTGFRAQAGFTDINLFDRGWRWSNLLRIEALQQTVSTQIALPVSANGWRNDFGLAYLHTDLQRLDTRNFTFNANHAKTEGRIERAVTLVATTGTEQAEGSSRNHKQAVAPGYSWRYRDLDNLITPRNGYDLTLSVAGGAKAALSDADFVRTYGRWIGIKDLTPRDSILLRVEAGVVFAQSRQGIPNLFLFRAGGDQSLRGYRYNSIGVSEGNAIVGGRYLLIGGAEYVRWIRPQWGAAVFYEVGDAFDDRSQFSAKRGYGVGARWRSPVGPINADVAYGEQARSIRFHLSVGFAF